MSIERVMGNVKVWWFVRHIQEHYPSITLRCPYCHKTFDQIVKEEYEHENRPG